MTYGFNGEDNIDFFGRKLGRTALNQVKPDLRSVLMPDRDIDDEDFLQYYTFDFFDPKDAVRFRL